MVRKQLNITRTQDDALKQRAAQLGVSEAAVVRAAIDHALGTGPELTENKRAAMDEFLRAADKVRGKPPPAGDEPEVMPTYDRVHTYERRFHFGRPPPRPR